MAFSTVAAENTSELMRKATFQKTCAEALGTCSLQEEQQAYLTSMSKDTVALKGRELPQGQNYSP